MAQLTCPTCGKKFHAEKSKSMPFCSRVCREKDLNAWLNEEHGLPVEEIDESDLPFDKNENDLPR